MHGPNQDPEAKRFSDKYSVKDFPPGGEEEFMNYFKAFLRPQLVEMLF